MLPSVVPFCKVLTCAGIQCHCRLTAQYRTRASEWHGRGSICFSSYSISSCCANWEHLAAQHLEPGRRVCRLDIGQPHLGGRIHIRGRPALVTVGNAMARNHHASTAGRKLSSHLATALRPTNCAARSPSAAQHGWHTRVCRRASCAR